MTTEEKVKAKLDKWVVPGMAIEQCFRHLPRTLADLNDWGPVMSTARFDQVAIEHRTHERWMVVELDTDTLRLCDVHYPEESDDYTISPVPDNFEEVQNWVRMIDNLTQG